MGLDDLGIIEGTDMTIHEKLDTILNNITGPKITEQTLTNSVSVSSDKSGSLTFTFNNLTKVSGITAFSINTYQKTGGINIHKWKKYYFRNI